MTAQERAIPVGHLNIIDALLARYDLTRGAVTAVPESVLNTNYCVQTEGGPRFARIHGTRRDGDRVRREHRVAHWAAGRGLPAVEPLADRDGNTLHRAWGVFTSLFPWVEGRHARPGALTPAEARTLGGLLGSLQHELRDYEDPTLDRGKAGSRWDTGESIETLNRVDDLIRYYPAIPAEQRRIQEALRHQLALLESNAPGPSQVFDELPRQPCHGDFHERNVILRGDGSVAGVVDWELVSLLPPGYELIRAITLLGLLDSPALLEAFMVPYRVRVPAGRLLYHRAVEMRWQAILHDTWVYQEVFVRGNDRAAQFFDSHRRWVERFSDRGFRESLADRLAG